MLAKMHPGYLLVVELSSRNCIKTHLLIGDCSDCTAAAHTTTADSFDHTFHAVDAVRVQRRRSGLRHYAQQRVQYSTNICCHSQHTLHGRGANRPETLKCKDSAAAESPCRLWDCQLCQAEGAKQKSTHASAHSRILSCTGRLAPSEAAHPQAEQHCRSATSKIVSCAGWRMPSGAAPHGSALRLSAAPGGGHAVEQHPLQCRLQDSQLRRPRDCQLRRAEGAQRNSTPRSAAPSRSSAAARCDWMATELPAIARVSRIRTSSTCIAGAAS